MRTLAIQWRPLSHYAPGAVPGLTKEIVCNIVPEQAGGVPPYAYGPFVGSTVLWWRSVCRRVACRLQAVPIGGDILMHHVVDLAFKVLVITVLVCCSMLLIAGTCKAVLVIVGVI